MQSWRNRGAVLLRVPSPLPNRGAFLLWVPLPLIIRGALLLWVPSPLTIRSALLWFSTFHYTSRGPWLSIANYFIILILNHLHFKKRIETSTRVFVCSCSFVPPCKLSQCIEWSTLLATIIFFLIWSNPFYRRLLFSRFGLVSYKIGKDFDSVKVFWSWNFFILFTDLRKILLYIAETFNNNFFVFA